MVLSIFRTLKANTLAYVVYWVSFWRELKEDEEKGKCRDPNTVLWSVDPISETVKCTTFNFMPRSLGEALKGRSGEGSFGADSGGVGPWGGCPWKGTWERHFRKALGGGSGGRPLGEGPWRRPLGGGTWEEALGGGPWGVALWDIFFLYKYDLLQI